MKRLGALVLALPLLASPQARAAETPPILEVRCTAYFLAETASARQASRDPAGSEQFRADMRAQAKEAEALMNVAMQKAFDRGARDVESDVKEIALAHNDLDERGRRRNLQECLPLFQK